ncbi:MAG: HAD family hydrolase [Alphaproteobacteria bacterium]|nr:HAD family hydrolase [Alphaproteobacteria bacterium]MCW5742963.1 HAD family hydrolase [Alphaproteobacteria bacterium]
MTRAYEAILFDVGGPLDMEFAWEIAVDSAIAAACALEGIRVDEEMLAAASRRAVEVFASDAYTHMVESLCGGDPRASARVRRRVRETLSGLDTFQLRPGIDALLQRLVVRGLKLAIVANQSASAVDRLQRAGIGRHFTHLALSEVVGVRKPDAAIFLGAAQALGVPPQRCIMVGDRIDNDIAPAKALGMAAIRFRSGRHARQQPRSPSEAPDADVVDVLELERAIEALLSG